VLWLETRGTGGVASCQKQWLTGAWVKIGGARGAWEHGFKLLVG